MRLALLSDLHANLQALQACLAHARDQGADAFAFLGDLVGYGAQPAQVLAEVRQLAHQGAIVLRGNHDDSAATGAGGNSAGAVAAAWTHAQLGSEDRQYLAALPLSARVGDALLVHATADDPPAWRYADHPARAAASLEAAGEAGARIVFCGHVHAQQLYYQGRGSTLMVFEPAAGQPVPLTPNRRWLATIGSVGQPRDGDPRAMYALWEPDTGSRLTFHRVVYPHLQAAEAIRRTGQPASFADRLLEGR